MSKQVIPNDVKAAMWQFFLKTSVPRLIEKKRMEGATVIEKQALVDKDLLEGKQEK